MFVNVTSKLFGVLMISTTVVSALPPVFPPVTLAGYGINPFVFSHSEATVSAVAEKSISTASRKFRAEAPLLVKFTHDAVLATAKLPSNPNVPRFAGQPVSQNSQQPVQLI